MARKAIALINQQPELKEICERIESRTQFMRKQLENLKEKMEAVAKQAHEENEPEWEALRDKLMELGLIESYNDQTHFLSFSSERNVIEMGEKGDEHPIAEILRGLFS